MTKVVTFGEIMLRLSPPGYERFAQARSFDVVYGGAEANVAISLANYGVHAEFVTRLPENDLGEACLAYLHYYGVRTDHVVRGGDRLGIYFLEKGAAQRASRVLYDRGGSSFATIQPGMVDWKATFEGADWFHWSGVAPAVSESAAQVCREALQVARQMGLTISCDVNYRAKLWKWGKSQEQVMDDLIAFCDVVSGIQVPGTVITDGHVDANKCRAACEETHKRFPNLKTIALSLRGSLSSRSICSGVLWHKGEFFVAPQYDLLPIVDRVGSGDAFMGGLIYGRRQFGNEHKRALRFAVAAFCLKHSIPGDANVVTVAEVEQLMSGDTSGSVSR